MNAEEYWRQQAASVASEYEVLVQGLRDEVSRLQRSCNDLLHERSMMKAATATDVRNFCLHYQADQQRRRGLTSAGAVTHMPVHTLMQFLHTYSNGLLPPPENRRKRLRGPEDEEDEGGSVDGSTAGPPMASPSPMMDGPSNRVFRRVLSRQRLQGQYEGGQNGEIADADRGEAAMQGAAPMVAGVPGTFPQQQQQQQQQQQHLDPSIVNGGGYLEGQR